MSPADIAGDPDILAVRATEFGRWVLDRCALDGDCWRWKSSTNNYGYPQINTVRFGRGMPHRMLFEQVLGEVLDPKTQRLQNRCGCRACCNPKHWRAVPAGQVIADQYRKKQRGSKERLRLAALKAHSARTQRVGSMEKAAQARELRAAGVPTREIAQRFGISLTSAKKWAGGKAWRPATPFSGLGR